MSLGTFILPATALTGSYPEGFQLLVNHRLRPRDGQQVVVATASGAQCLAFWPVGPEWDLVGRVEKWELAPGSR